jgi:hypothetical protein
MPTIDLADLGLDEGGAILLARALAPLAPGERLRVDGAHPLLALHLSTWCRAKGHRSEEVDGVLWVERGGAVDARWRGAARAGGPSPEQHATSADPAWGFAARGALVEAGGPPSIADLHDDRSAWCDLAPQLYAQAVAAQWDPSSAIDWAAPITHGDAVEAAVCQVMTYLIENEMAALVVPSRFIARVHPHFREVVQLLAIQCADEARHVEVFTRRATLRTGSLGTSSVGGRASLHTLTTEHDYDLATFLLSVLGEGSFLSLLGFLERHAPDPVTAQVARLALQDEARHVAFGQAHLEHAVRLDPQVRDRLRSAIERRHDALAGTAGLNADTFDALTVLAAGEWSIAALRRGWAAVQDLQRDMDLGRRRRLVRLGFSEGEASDLAGLHTRNFM